MPRINNTQEVALEKIEGKLEQNFPDLVSPSEVREILNSSGASVADVTTKLVEVFQTSDQDKTVHDIAKTFLGMHGVLKDQEHSGTSINLIIQSEDAKVMQILNPER